jgi:hypothetical protein
MVDEGFSHTSFAGRGRSKQQLLKLAVRKGRAIVTSQGASGYRMTARTYKTRAEADGMTLKTAAE